MMKTKTRWYDWLWIASGLYLILGFVNILFAWLGLICFIVPLLISVIRGNKAYCNKYCGRGQLFSLLGEKLHLSRNKPIPAWIRSKWFRYGFLTFFMIMFFNMLYVTWLVFAGSNSLQQTVTLLWTFRLPWQWAYTDGLVTPWAAQFAFGFLQRDADLYGTGNSHHGHVQTPLLVCVLPHGHHDPANL